MNSAVHYLLAALLHKPLHQVHPAAAPQLAARLQLLLCCMLLCI
jgi:hypothetical protein